jgi:predicted unusual protein kinase regulating ubiquinone biosynthesis (AarF/ABC1/UbiB family)
MLILGTPLSKLIAESEWADENTPICGSSFIAAHGQAIARLGLHMFLSMMIDYNFMHCDLHPGNMLIQTDDCIACNKADEGDHTYGNTT